ncbi:MAG: VIT and vWA domain-containing protein [Burkholderiaceae bacterium]
MEFTHRVARYLGFCAAAFACAALLTTRPVAAQDRDAPATKTESPYFFIKSDDPTVDQLPLKSTRVDVRIAGVIADVTVTQQYKNEGTRAIEARYVFPGSANAAVYAMNVRLAERLLTARIKEKQAARIEYEAAKTQGKTAALLEQQRPNVFEMNVANILPGDDVRVELRYTELLVPRDGQYQFVYPTVVGPRYNSPSGSAAKEKWVSNLYAPANTAIDTAFDLNVQMTTPIGIKQVQSTSHDVEVEGEGTTIAKVSLPDTGKVQNNRDFILNYRLAGDAIESGVMLFKGAEENFFLAMVQPPKVVPATAINPREYIFLVDISGSMHGFPLETSKAMLQKLIGQLRPSDTFNVMLFSGSAQMLNEHSVPATKANIDQAIATINQQRGGGSTEIVPALKRIAAYPKQADVARTVIIVTDGYVAVEKEVFQLVRKHLNSTNVFAFGIGSSVNRHLMDGIARAGQSEPFIITKPAEAAKEADRFKKMIEAPVLTQVKAKFEGLDVYDVEPANLPDVLSERPVIVFGKWKGEAKGQIVIEGMSANGAYRNVIQVNDRISQDTAALRYLWVRNRITQLSDQEALEGGDGQRAAILSLGLKYNLLTQYTSFIAVDQVVRNLNLQPNAQVQQPSPLPEGVSNLALGVEVPSTPEPETWLALLVALLAAASIAIRRSV